MSSMRSVSGTQGSSGGLAAIGSTAGTASAGSAASGDSGFGAVLGASVAGNPGAGDRPGTGDQTHAGDHKDDNAASDQGDTAAASLAALLGSIPAKAGVTAAPSTDAAPAAASDGKTAPAAANDKDAHPGDGKKSIGDGAAQTGTLTGAPLVAAPATPASQNKTAGDAAAVSAGQADDDSAGGVDAAPAASLDTAAPTANGLPMGAVAAGDIAPANGLRVAAETHQVAAQAAVSSGAQANPATDAIAARAVADMAARSTGSAQKIAQPNPVAASPHAAKTGAAKTSAENVLQAAGAPATDQDTQQASAPAPAVVSIVGLTSAPQRDPAGTGDLSKLPGAPSSIDTNNFNAGAINQSTLATPTPAPDSHVSAQGSTAAPELIGADGAPQPMAGAVTTQVLSMIANGHDQVTLHVSPPALGDLTLRVDVQANNVSTWFGAAQPQVQQAVTDALAQLQTSLSGAGFNLVGAWVGADASAGRGQQSMPQPPRRTAGIDALPGVAAAAPRSSDTDSSRVSVYV